MRTLTITVNPDWEAVMQEAENLAEAAIETGQYQGEKLNFETLEAFSSKLPSYRREMLVILKHNKSIGIGELARKLGKDIQQVNEDVNVLMGLGLIEKDEHGALLCPYDHINFECV